MAAQVGGSIQQAHKEKLMVTIKGTKISNKLARDSIKAMEQLIYLYKHPKKYKKCPLCAFQEGAPMRKKSCHRCPWYILKDRSCVLSHFSSVRFSPTATRNRIRQLGRWIEIYKKALGAK